MTAPFDLICRNCGMKAGRHRCNQSDYTGEYSDKWNRWQCPGSVKGFFTPPSKDELCDHCGETWFEHIGTKCSDAIGHFYSKNPPLPKAPADVSKITYTAKAVNDFTCPHCKNTKCSSTERICWLCGDPLH